MKKASSGENRRLLKGERLFRLLRLFRLAT